MLPGFSDLLSSQLEPESAQFVIISIIIYLTLWIYQNITDQQINKRTCEMVPLSQVISEKKTRWTVDINVTCKPVIGSMTLIRQLRLWCGGALNGDRLL